MIFYKLVFYYDRYVNKVTTNQNPHIVVINPIFTSRMVKWGTWWHCLQQQQQQYLTRNNYNNNFFFNLQKLSKWYTANRETFTQWNLLYLCEKTCGCGIWTTDYSYVSPQICICKFWVVVAKRKLLLSPAPSLGLWFHTKRQGH